MRRLTPFFFAAALFLVSAQVQSFEKLVVLGDSYSDSGNNALAFDAFFAGFGLPPGLVRTPTPVPPAAFVPTFPYATDRYSNGRVWAEYAAEALDLQALPSLAGGTNYAFGGARSGPVGTSFSFPDGRPSLRDQANFYTGSGPVNADTLHAVAGGGNDARDALAVLAGGGNPSALIASYATNVATIVSQLDSAGARHILISNIADLGMFPAVRLLGASAAGSFISMSMNNALDAALAAVSLHPNTNLYRFDAFDWMHRVAANPGAFGMTDTTSACGINPACIADPSHTFFWDGIHMTTAGHQLLANEVLQAIPEPETYAMLLAGLGLLGFVAQRRRMQQGAAA